MSDTWHDALALRSGPRLFPGGEAWSAGTTPPRVLLFGGDGGWGNLGDQAMLINTVARLRRTFPGCRMTVLAERPEQLPGLQDVERVAWPRALATNKGAEAMGTALRLPGLWRLWRVPALLRGLRFVRAARSYRGDQTGGQLRESRLKGVSTEALALLDLLAASDLVVNYGSGGLNEIWAADTVYSWSFCYLAARALGKRVLVTGQGIGPLPHPLDRRLLCAALDCVDAVTVRDYQDSAELLRQGGVRRPVLRITADDASSLATASRALVLETLAAEGVPPNSGGPLVAFHFRSTAFDTAVGRDEQDGMAAVADRLVEEAGARVLFVSTVSNVAHGIDDRAAADSVVARMKHPESVTILRGLYDPSLTKGIVAEADLAVGTSYHFLLFALTSGVPALGLYKGGYYARKLHGLFRHFDLDDAVIDLSTCEAGRVARQALDLLQIRAAVSARLQDRTRHLEEALDEVWEQVHDWLADPCLCSGHHGSNCVATGSYEHVRADPASAERRAPVNRRD